MNFPKLISIGRKVLVTVLGERGNNRVLKTKRTKRTNMVERLFSLFNPIIMNFVNHVTAFH